ncbi:MAG: deoxyribose-phosphate aldolase [Oscillospiraceae bacterium]|jgi:deoxyribose-phosphate aldolase|nr:deoxyribose-phosphate aldolase [Oscillospiraceae bacterium]
MEKSEIYAKIDHTLLKPTATLAQILTLCGEAERLRMASVCIPPTYIARARQAFPKLRIGTVVGFPLGYHAAEIKAAEARFALEDGADEVDAVVNVGDVKNGDFDAVSREVALLREVTRGKTLKLIVETCYLTEDEKIALCEIVTARGVDYIKTSTGFGSGVANSGATLEDIELFRRHIGENVKIKASGGIRTRAAIEAFILAGCDRIGCSSAVVALGDGNEGD